MTDPRAALRAAYARWLCLRADVRALAGSLVAAEHALRRDLRRSGEDAHAATLVQQIVSERSAVNALAADLDVRIADVKAECDAIEAGYLATVRAAGRRLNLF